MQNLKLGHKINNSHLHLPLKKRIACETHQKKTGHFRRLTDIIQEITSKPVFGFMQSCSLFCPGMSKWLPPSHGDSMATTLLWLPPLWFPPSHADSVATTLLWLPPLWFPLSCVDSMVTTLPWLPPLWFHPPVVTPWLSRVWLPPDIAWILA